MANAITPTSVQKTYTHSTGTYGTPVRLVRYFVVLTKAAQNDWIVTATYTPGTYLGCKAYTIDGSANGAGDPITYATSGTKAVMTSANTGTAYLEVLVQES